MNLCPCCLKSRGIDEPNPLLSDVGECGGCGAVVDVYDIDLVDLYTGLDLSPEFVWKELPRLRCTPSGVIGFREIGEIIRAKLFKESD